MTKRSAKLVEGARKAVEERYARFVAAYLIHNNATKAAIEAGYSPKSAHIQGHHLLKIPKIHQAIERGRAKINAKLEVTSERVVAELARIGFADMRKAIAWGTQEHVRMVGRQKVTERRPHMEFVDSSDLDDDTAGAISEVSMTAHGMKLKFYDKRAALVDLGKVTGIFADGPDLTVPVSFVIERK